MTAVEAHPASVSLVKMEERKRPAAYDADEVAPPSKRQVTTACVNGETRSHSDADMPGRDDMEKFQKEAIYRQMREYKREKVTLEGQLKDVQKRAANHDDHLRYIDSWFVQLVDEIRLLIDKSLPSDSSFSPFPSSLLTSNNDEFQKFLESRSKTVSSVVEKLFGQPTSSGDRLEELQEETAKLLNLQKEHINEMERALSEKNQLEERLESASMRYMLAEKKIDRAKSMTVAKLERQATAGGRSEAGSGIGGAQTATKPESPTTQVDQELLAEAEQGRKAAVAASAKQTEQIEQLAAENEKLMAQVSTLTLKASSVTDDDFANTDLFKQLKTHHDDAVKKANNLEALHQEIRQEISKLQAERTAHKAKLDAEAQTVISEKDVLLARAEADLARIRTARDELHADLQTRKAAQDEDRTAFGQVKQQVAARDDQIKALESALERLSKSQSEDSNGLSEDISPDDLRTKYTNLEKQYKMLNGELKSMSDAYKKIASANSQKVSNLSELEEKVMRLSAEKAKADQKYFAAMKAKDSREQEVRALRAQNAKSSDIVSQLKEAEAAKGSLTVNLEKQLAETNEALSSVQLKLKDAQHQADQRRSQVDGLKKEMEELKSFVAPKDSAISAAASGQRKLEVKVEELKAQVEEKEKRLESWRNRGAASGNESEDYIRTLVICTICRNHVKNTIIKTCGHVFCNDCVDDRLQNRMRKCPNCGKAFGMNDCMRFTL